jgi:hypothetical protein
MEPLNPRWLSIEMARAEAAVGNWPTDLKKSFEAVAFAFRMLGERAAERGICPDQDTTLAADR